MFTKIGDDDENDIAFISMGSNNMKIMKNESCNTPQKTTVN